MTTQAQTSTNTEITNPNENCLDGMSCPKCGRFGPFRIFIKSAAWVLFEDSGREEMPSGDMEYDNASGCECPGCKHVATVGAFKGVVVDLSSFNPFQQIVMQSYTGAEDLILDPPDFRDCGDTLLEFLLAELSECEAQDDAVRHVSSAIRQLERISVALQKESQADSQNESDALPGWTAEHELKAAREGWGLFHTEGSSDGDWQIQRIDNPDDYAKDSEVRPAYLASDNSAWYIVGTGKGPHHILARELLKKYNPYELEVVTKAASTTPPANVESLIDGVLSRNDGNGIYSVGANAAIKAMNYHWNSHFAEGHSVRIITDDIEGMKDQLNVVVGEVIDTLLNPPTPKTVSKYQDLELLNIGNCRYEWNETFKSYWSVDGETHALYEYALTDADKAQYPGIVL